MVFHLDYISPAVLCMAGYRTYYAIYRIDRTQVAYCTYIFYEQCIEDCMAPAGKS